MHIYRVTDKEFARYGRVLSLDVQGLIEAARDIPMPESGSVYHASEEAFEALPVAREIADACFGELPTQIGYCYGHSNRLNALEWHKSSEINVAVTDLVLLLGDVRDMDDNGEYDSAKVQAFLLKQGESVEIYATTLHFCPIEAHERGFGCVVALPVGTNTDLQDKPDDPRLFRKNKWIIAHKENEALLARGVVGGIYGENYCILPQDLGDFT